jgi:hypothetical protein
MTELLHCGSISGAKRTKKAGPKPCLIERMVFDYSAGGGGVSVPFAIFCKR